ncbi:MAG: DUF1643 domain-containing protein [Fimbriiglobus sp.]
MTEYTNRGADLSACGAYRLSLFREWAGFGDKRCCFVLLNPSTADGTLDDPTIVKCVEFARRLDCGSMEVRNLYPFRATDPKDMVKAADPCGGLPGSVALIRALSFEFVVCGWGAFKPPKVWGARHTQRVAGFFDQANIKGVKLKAIRLNKDGSPAHPLYLPYTSQLIDLPLPKLPVKL